MMTQLSSLDEQAINQWELEQYINQQALLVSFEQGASQFIKFSAKNFLPKDESSRSIKYEATPTPNSERETIRHMLIGSSKAVIGTIKVLQQLGYAQVGDWSPLLPSPTNPREVMSILVRQILV